MPPERYTVFSKGLEQLRAGNPEALQEAGAAKDLQLLWSYYLASWADKDIRAVIASQLAVIPGHAQYVGDMVEAITNTTYDDRKPVQSYGGTMPRNYAFRILDSLGTLATPEAIQQIGRFLYDDRNPEMRGNLVTGQRGPGPANNRYALRALNKAVGDASPIAGKVNAVEMAEPGDYSAQVIREWWASDASLPFRQPLPGVELPEIVRNPPKLPHVDLNRFKPSPPQPVRFLVTPLPKVTPQAQADADRLLKRPPAKPHPFALPSRTPPAAAPPPVIATSDARWLYLLPAAALLLLSIWLAARRRKRLPSCL